MSDPSTQGQSDSAQNKGVPANFRDWYHGDQDSYLKSYREQQERNNSGNK